MIAQKQSGLLSMHGLARELSTRIFDSAPQRISLLIWTFVPAYEGAIDVSLFLEPLGISVSWEPRGEGHPFTSRGLAPVFESDG